MTQVYLASPRTQQQAQAAESHNVLLSFATWTPWIMGYVQSFDRIMLDSGAFSELNSGVRIDLAEYIDWVAGFAGQIEAYAGLDDISGDWRRSLRNYEAGGFPTFHDTDPPELLDELVAMSRERGSWIGIGLKPPRQGKDQFIRETLERLPEDIHVHGWACRLYTRHRRFDSVDSTNWFRSAMELRSRNRFALTWLTFGECLDIQIKRIVREARAGGAAALKENTEQLDLFRKAP